MLLLHHPDLQIPQHDRGLASQADSPSHPEPHSSAPKWPRISKSYGLPSFAEMFPLNYQDKDEYPALSTRLIDV